MNRWGGWRPTGLEIRQHAAQMRHAQEQMLKLTLNAVNTARENYAFEWLVLNPNEWPRDWVLREEIDWCMDELITKFWMERL